MIRLNKKIVLSVLVASQLTNLYAEGILDTVQGASDSYNSIRTKHWNDGKIYIDAKAKAGSSFWDPGLSDEDPKSSTDIISYQTEGLSYYDVSVNLGYSGTSIFSYSKLASFTETENQQELLATNKSAESGVDGYTMGFSLEAIVKKLGIRNSIVNTALTYRFEMTDTAFFGVATAEQDIYYYTNSEYGDLINEGKTISFKTTFKEQRHTVASKYLMKRTAKDAYLRMGLYKSEWTKPTSFGNRSSDGKPAIEMAEYSTTGITLVYTNYEGSKVDGLNFDFTLDYGLDNTFKSFNSDASANLGEEESLAYGAVKIDSSYKWVPIKSKYSTLSFIIGASMDFKQWSIADGDDDSDNNVKLDAETLYALYSSVEFRFGY